MSNSSRARLNYIDWAKAVSIVLIVTGHMLPSGCGPKTLMYAFHVPIFALIGGLLFSAPDSWRSFSKKLFGIFKRMVIPYVVWFCVSSSFYFMAADKMPNIVKGSATTDITRLIRYFFFYESATVWNDPLWFMPCYIFVSCLFLLFTMLTRGNRYASAGISLLSFTALAVLEGVGVTLNIGGVKNALGFYNYLLLFGFLALGHAVRPLLDRCARLTENPTKNPVLYAALGLFVISAVLCLMHNRVDTPAGYYTLSLYSGLYNGFISYVLFATSLSITLLLSLMLLPGTRAALLCQKIRFSLCAHTISFSLICRFLGLRARRGVNL